MKKGVSASGLKGKRQLTKKDSNSIIPQVGNYFHSLGDHEKGILDQLRNITRTELSKIENSYSKHELNDS